ncbi:HAMP domain-containing histidine kinase [Aurantimonas sp. MSK8Z-1]|uniref:sensor histidine kinase n=1 Tax=Mangrovibrevibacter kandeliae TaxID=2968473 RepID=UPI002118172F|nr:HAMP domain-containing sensor histidine kinase [Aurantimonas sp. MSK8Z-1]MCW4113882.1 HAMP domain-containing histidine kinase [Aurantimonas sp. MSK8Z-1]
MQRLRALMRMTAVRLSALYLGLFAVFAVILVFYVTGTATSLLEQQTRDTIDEEIDQLSRVYRSGGIVGLVRTIDRRARQPGASLYLMTDPSGRILAGNVESLQPGTLDDTGFTDEAFAYRRFTGSERDGRLHLAVAEVMSLPNGMRILVGRDQTEVESFRFLVRRALILALGLMGIIGLLVWFVVGRRALQRLDRMSFASARILAGDLHERLPVTGAGDEFDRLSDNLNTLLGRIALLQEGLRQVSDNIAHDLKTPLTRLRNRAENALHDAEPADASRPALEGMIGEADQMIRTFDALLMIARVEAGFHPAAKEPADISAIVADVAELYEPLAEEAGAALRVEPSPPVQLKVSRELIAQALSNLLENALKYATADGRQATVRVGVEASAERCVLWVADDGPGIPAEKRGRVLERFYRLDESRSKPGSGLGLSLVQAVAQLHGGRLRLEDAAPGLKVCLDLPRDDESDGE